MSVSPVAYQTPKRQAWLQTGPPTYSPPEKKEESKKRKKPKSCEDESSSGEEYTLTSFGDVSPEDPYVPLGSRRFNLRTRVSRPPKPGKQASATKEYDDYYARVLAQHLRNAGKDDPESPSTAEDFKALLDSVRASRRKSKAMKRMRSEFSSPGSSMSVSPRSTVYSSTTSSPRTPLSISSVNSSPRTPASSKCSSSYDPRDYGSPVPASRSRRRAPIPSWD